MSFVNSTISNTYSALSAVSMSTTSLRTYLACNYINITAATICNLLFIATIKKISNYLDGNKFFIDAKGILTNRSSANSIKEIIETLQLGLTSSMFQMTFFFGNPINFVIAGIASTCLQLGLSKYHERSKISQLTWQPGTINRYVADEQTQNLENLLLSYTSSTNDFRRWLLNFHEDADRENLQRLSKSQLLHLQSLFISLNENRSLDGPSNLRALFNECQSRLNACTPREILTCRDIIKSRSNCYSVMHALNKIKGLSTTEKWEALGHYISIHQVKLKDLDPTDQEWILLAPFLRYVNLNEADGQLIEKAFHLCTNIHHLTIESNEFTTLPPLPYCQTLHGRKCGNLREVGALPSCKHIYFNDCPNLQLLPALPNCRYFMTDNCPTLTQLPEFPWNATVYHGDGEMTKLKVDINDLATNPKKWLLKLGKFLLKRQPFPNVYYFENGQRNEAVDVGGVRRDFIARLCDKLFIKDNTDNEHLNFEEEGYVPAPETASEEAKLAANKLKDCYRTLGKFFAICLQPNSYFKTGPLLPVELYQCISCPTLPRTTSEECGEWYLNGYLTLRKSQDLIPYLSGQTAIPDEMPEEMRRRLTYFVNSEAEKLLTTEEICAQITAICAELIKEAFEDKQLLALREIVLSMEETLGETRWLEVCRGGSEQLKDRIEGVLSQEALRTRIVWKPSEGIDISSKQYMDTQAYLDNWIGRADMAKLRSFVRAVTGNNALGSDRLKIEVYNRGDQNYPSSHTCFFSMELSCDYPNQPHFDEKIEHFLLAAERGFQNN